MRASFKALAAIIVAVFGISAFVSSPAMASKSECSSGYICIWPNASYAGGVSEWSYTYVYNANSNHCVNFTGQDNDSTSSMYADFTNPREGGNGGIGVVFFKDANCNYGSAHLDYYTPASVSNYQGSGFNDTFSSVQVP